MASYEEKDYEPVLLESIRPNVEVPFDCYLLLKANDRIVHFIKKGQVFPEDKVEKLKQFRYNNLYIHVSSKSEYLTYLKSFFKSDEGQAVLKDLQEQGANKASLESQGIPAELDLTMLIEIASAQSDHSAEELAGDPPEIEPIAVIDAKPRQEDPEVQVIAQDSQVDETVKLIPEGASLLEQVVASLKGDVEELSEEVAVSGLLSEEQMSVLQNAAEQIEAGLQRVQGSGSGEFSDREVQEVSDRIQEELNRVRAISSEVDPKLGKVILETVNATESEVKKIASEDSNNRETPKEKVRHGALRLKRLAEPKKSRLKENEIATESVNRMVKKVEAVLGVKLVIQAETSNTASDVVAEIGKTRLLIPPRSAPNASSDELRSENEVLRAQLLNARSLLDKSGIKISELKIVNEKNDHYIGVLEKESLEHKETLRRSQSQLSEVELENIRHGEHNAELEKQLQIKKAEEEAKDLNMNELRSKILSLESNLRVFSEAIKNEVLDPTVMKEANLEKLPFKPEAVALVIDKEKLITKLAEQLSLKADETKEAKKEIAKLKNQVQGTHLLKKEMSSKVERINTEKDTIAKSQDAMHRKMIMLQNLAEGERKTVVKLSQMIEDLRKERLEHMAKTTAAMRDFKEAMGKANSLNNQVQVETFKNKTLNEQNQAMLAKQKELASENVQLQKNLKNLEAELKRLQRLHKDANESKNTVDKVSLEKRIQELREDNHRLQTQFVTEQRKAQQLEKDLKALQFKTKNNKSNAA